MSKRIRLTEATVRVIARVGARLPRIAQGSHPLVISLHSREWISHRRKELPMARQILTGCTIGLLQLALCCTLMTFPSRATAALETNSQDHGTPQASDPEPQYFGKPTVYWIDKLSVDDVKVRRKAIEALTTIGPDAKNAVPALIKALDDDDAEVRIGAIGAIGAIGPAAKQAVADLARFMSDRSPVFCMQAIKTIVKIGVVNETSVSALLKAMKDGADDEARYAALDGLKSLGNDAIDMAAPRLLSLIKDKTRKMPHQRQGTTYWQLEILGILPSDKAETQKLLVSCLEEANPDVYEPAADVLAKMGPKAKFAIPALRKLAKSFPETRTDKTSKFMWPEASAARALVAIGPDAQPTILELLGDKEFGSTFARGMYDTWRYLDKAVPILAETLQSGTPTQRANAALAFVFMTENRYDAESAKVALPVLQMALKDNDATVRQNAQKALKNYETNHGGPYGSPR